MLQVEQEKRCSKCKESKPLTEFCKNRAQRDGMHNQCKPCKSVSDRANQHRHREYKRRWREANPERHHETRRKWLEKNRDWFAEYQRVYAAKRIGSRDPDQPWPERTCSYGAAHLRILYTRGKAAEHSCVDCGDRAAEWSYNHAADQELSQILKSGWLENRDASYSADPMDYDPRCRSCHVKFDR